MQDYKKLRKEKLKGKIEEIVRDKAFSRIENGVKTLR